MSDRVHLPRHDLRKHNVEPMPAWGYDAGMTPFIRCACGLCMGIGDHTVESDGTINPSVWHDVPECGWHVMAILDDWMGYSK